MLRKKKNNIEWLEFNLLADDPRIVHGVFLRHGGVSQGCFSSLNATKGKGDDPTFVDENRLRMVDCLGLKGISSSWQIHGNRIKPVGKEDIYLGECDGLTTDLTNWGLMIMHADCQAAIFYDPVNIAITNVHAGWRGQVQDIYRHTIEKMRILYGTKASDLRVCISPSLGPENSEFKYYRQELPEEFWSFQIRPTYFNLWEIAHYQLESCGVLPKHIEIAKIDTYANPEDFFSYRREKATGREGSITGCHGTIVGLKQLGKG
jgi:YfiH family protein